MKIIRNIIVKVRINKVNEDNNAYGTIVVDNNIKAL